MCVNKDVWSFFASFSPPCTPHTIPRVERLGYRLTHHWALWVSFSMIHAMPFQNTGSCLPLITISWIKSFNSCSVPVYFPAARVQIMCVLKICMPVFSVSHLISRHFKWSISLLCGWSFLIPVIRVFPVFSTELIFCTSYNWIFSSVRFFSFF